MIHTNRFCQKNEFGYSCVECPEYATCSNYKIESCEGERINDGYQCLRTNKNIEELKELHNKILDIFKKNTSKSALEVFELMDSDLDLDDFYSALVLNGEINTDGEGKIIKNFITFNRSKSIIKPSPGDLGIVLVLITIVLKILNVLDQRAFKKRKETILLKKN